ncbi:taurine transport system permease protein [Alkalibacterium subtropicum]|uniref:Taurine transport system permease protein n=1 Tax=Alkalibacterium subtropicum TaxID=753702 RepID=A0A1I1H3L1_9LACT|nr:ABC transporter permease [Alkalibacterium subtropicum]SFC16033.1 taurine transport system permease protein [Alkalibacterium subtropicum]
MKRQKMDTHLERALTLGTWVVILLVWVAATRSEGLSSHILPSPQQVWRALVQIMQEGYNQISLWQHLGDSFIRLFGSLFLAIITAIPLGLLSGFFPKFRAIIDSLVQFYRPIPPLAYYALLILWMGIEDGSKITLLYLAAFAPVYIACVAAVSSINRDYVLSAQSLGASQKDVFMKIILPAAMPDIFTGVRTASGFAYTTLVAAEMTAATSGIGWMVIDASRYLKSDVMFVGIILMGITGLLMDGLFILLERKFIFWKGNE